MNAPQYQRPLPTPAPASGSGGFVGSAISLCICICCIYSLSSSAAIAYTQKEAIDRYFIVPAQPSDPSITAPEYFYHNQETTIEYVTPVWPDAVALVEARLSENGEVAGSPIFTKEITFSEYMGTVSIPTTQLDVGLLDIEVTLTFVTEGALLDENSIAWIEDPGTAKFYVAVLLNPLGRYVMDLKNQTHIMGNLEFDIRKFPVYRDEHDHKAFYELTVRIVDVKTDQVYDHSTYAIAENPNGVHPTTSDGKQTSNIRYQLNIWDNIVNPCKWIQEHKPSKLPENMRSPGFTEDIVQSDIVVRAFCSINFKQGERIIEGSVVTAETLFIILDSPSETYMRDCCPAYFDDPAATAFTCSNIKLTNKGGFKLEKLKAL